LPDFLDMKKKAPEMEVSKITARVPRALAANVKIRAVQRRITLQEAIIEALAGWLKETRS
jgi:hypothetical protein